MDKALDESEWKQMRRSGIGGSDVGSIIGVNPWRTALDVFLDKTGQSPDFEPNEDMELGTALEPYIVSRYEKLTGLKCVEQQGMWREGVVVANVDRIVDMGDGRTQAPDGRIISKRIVECKTSNYDWEDGVPQSYICQVQWYMGPFPEVESCDVVVYFKHRKTDRVQIFNIKRDDEVYAVLLKKATEFWEKYVKTGIMPPPETEKDCKFLYKQGKKATSVEANEKAQKAYDECKKLSEEIDALEEKLGKAKAVIMAEMKANEILKDKKGKVLVTWKNDKDSVKVDFKAIATALRVDDKMIARYTTVKPGSRKFCIK